MSKHELLPVTLAREIKEHLEARLSVWDDVVRLIGEDAAMSLWIAYGATRIVVPTRFSPDMELCRVVGKRVAEKMVNALGGQAINVANSWRREYMRERNKMLVSLYNKGAGIRKLAVMSGLGERQLRAILNNPDITDDVLEELQATLWGDK